MDLPVFLAVLVAAAMHAGWNVLVKAAGDRFLSVAFVSIAAAPLALPLVLFLPLPEAAALPWLLASVLLQTAYQIFLAKAYEAGDLAQVYPLARGAAPLLVAIAGTALVGERLSFEAWAGILVLSGGILAMALRGAGAAFARSAVGFALLTACFIALYTLCDGIGARANGSAHSYTAWLFLLNGVAMTVVVLFARGRTGLYRPPAAWRLAFAGGFMAFASYWVAVWAMTQSPIALVAALRESSILFASLIGVLILKERATFWRGLSAGMILCGIALLRLG